MNQPETVLDKVIERCRAAFAAGIPIIYIKTDSRQLIRQIVESDKLVVRIDSDRKRPVRENPDSKARCINWSETIPDNVDRITADLPHIWTVKAESRWVNPQFVSEEINKLERYIVAHENKHHEKYNMLQNSIMIVYSAQPYMSDMMKAYTEFIDVSLPKHAEIRNIIINEAELYGESDVSKKEDYISKLAEEFSGFTGEEVRLTMRKIMTKHCEEGSSFDDEEKVREEIKEHKKQKLQSPELKLITDTSASVGGMGSLTKWIKKQKPLLENADMNRRNMGIQPPKGVLLCGIPGCGKSEAAKQTATDFGMTLLQMDVGQLMGKYVGESEHNLQRALDLAEAMAPCILWIDELEKALSGAGKNDDSGPQRRMFGKLLTWMQEKKAPVFIFATANDIGSLPKEFFRSGRFDELFAVYLPTAEECANIFKARMEKREKDVGRKIFEDKCSDITKITKFVNMNLVKAGKPRIVVGADIEKIVNTAISGFDSKKKIQADSWFGELKNAAEKCGVYGDGEENIDSIAISYCRMLRKNMKPTSENVLFESCDYTYKNVSGAQAENSTSPTDTKIGIDKEVNNNWGEYDKAVFKLLCSRINTVAWQVEKTEMDRMIKG